MAEYTTAVRVAFGNNAFGASPTWVDISTDNKGFTTHRGRTYEMGRMEAGTASIVLNNTSGNYWKNNAAGSHYPNVIPMKPVNIQVSVSCLNLLTNTSFETGDPPTGWTLTGAGASWTRSSDYAHAGTYSGKLVRNGADCVAYQPVTYAPYLGKTVTFGAWVWCATPNIAFIQVYDGVGVSYSSYHPGDSAWHYLSIIKVISLSANQLTPELYINTSNGTAYFDDVSLLLNYDIFTGFSEAWTPGFVAPPIKIPQVTLSCVDLVKSLSRDIINNAGYASELSGTRVGHVLDDLSWPAGARTLAAGVSTLQATGSLSTNHLNAQSHLLAVQDTEQGIIFCGVDGKVVFHDRHTRLGSPYNTSQYTFTDTTNGHYAGIVPTNDDQYIYNDVHITRSGGTEQIAQDSTSITAYGLRSLAITGLLTTSDGESLSEAQYLVGKYAQPAQRVKQLVIKPSSDPTNLWPIVLGLDISSRITVVLTQASINEDYYIEGITHTYKPGQPWVTTYDLSPAASQAYWSLGDTGFSELGDTTILSY